VPGFAFNIARKIRRLDQYLMALLLEPELIFTRFEKLCGIAHELDIKVFMYSCMPA
jgi:hypothetical protein